MWIKGADLTILYKKQQFISVKALILQSNVIADTISLYLCQLRCFHFMGQFSKTLEGGGWVGF